MQLYGRAEDRRALVRRTQLRSMQDRRTIQNDAEQEDTDRRMSQDFTGQTGCRNEVDRK